MPWLYRHVRLSSDRVPMFLGIMENPQLAHQVYLRSLDIHGTGFDSTNVINRLVRLTPMLQYLRYDKILARETFLLTDPNSRVPLHSPLPASIFGIFLPKTALDAFASCDRSGSGFSSTTLNLVNLEIAIDPCLRADGVDRILRYISHHIWPLSEIQSLDLDVKKAESSVKPLDLTLSSFGRPEMIALPSLATLILKNFSFPPQHVCLPLSIPLARIKNLQLLRCSNTGYLFNSMLSFYQGMRLEALKIVDLTSSHVYGYVGKEKLDHFLLIYKDLKVLEIRGLGKPSPGLAAVLSQRKFLRVLKLDV